MYLITYRKAAATHADLSTAAVEYTEISMALLKGGEKTEAARDGSLSPFIINYKTWLCFVHGMMKHQKRTLQLQFLSCSVL